jgi:hypothetical protein
MQPDPRTSAGWQHQPVPPVTGWWFVVPLLTCGLGTPLMVLIGGLKLRSKLHTILAGGYLAAVVAAITAAAVADSASSGDDDSPFASILFFILWIVGTVHVTILQTRVRDDFFRQFPRQRPYGPGAAGPRPGLTHYQQPAWQQGARVDPELAAAQWRAARREEARQLQATEPLMASELMIGRPDLPGRRYDDGGLVDINHVPADWLVGYLKIDRALADRMVAAREFHDGFSSPEELLVYCDGLTPAKLALFRDRLLFIPR